MYEEYVRRSPHGGHASSPSSASSSTCSSSGVTRRTPSLRSSRHSPPPVWEEDYEHAESYEWGKTWRTQSQCGGGEIPHEREETRGDTRGGGERHSCNDFDPTRYNVTRDQNDHRHHHHGRKVNSWTSRKQYTYDLPHITNSQGIPGSPFSKNRPWSPDEEHIQVAACPRLGVVNDRIDQYPAPPQHFGDPPFSPSPRRIPHHPSTGWDDTFHSTSSSATAHTINDSVPKPERHAMMKRQSMSSGDALGISHRQGSRSSVLVSPFRFVFEWVCSAFKGLARSSSSSSKPEQRDSPARRSEFAFPKVEDDEETTQSDSSTAAAAAAVWLGSDEDDDGEESEVEEMVCTPSCLPRSRMNSAVDNCRSNQSCEEAYLHLDLEWDEYDKLLEDHTGAPGHLIHRRTAGSHHLIFSSGSSTIPFATIGLPHLPVVPCRFTPEIPGRCVSDVEYCDGEEEEGHVRFVGEEEEEREEVYCGALLSDHMYPRWQHYRFTAVSDARNELLIEERVPVTYLDEGMADAERLQDARRRKLELERWGRPLPGAIDWKDVRSWR